ncbi:MAG: type II secretion system protein GspN [Deltaproteobacteria bacterium]|nr:type II secretion system protein GspN [Deltaproteobacteria bacterium]MBN2686612.1 type II secretion system protein GspN [Deltaproteobacteria bacterium]
MRKKQIGAYIIYTVLATLAFLYLLFPSEAIERHIISAVTQTNPNLAFSIGTVTLGFPPALDMENVSLRSPRYPESPLKADRVTVSPSVKGLLTGTPTMSVHTRAYDGAIRGGIGFKNGSKNPVMTIRADGDKINVGKCPYIASVMRRTITGTMKGTLTYDGTYDEIIKGSGSADILLENGSFQLLKNMFGFDKIDFDRITATMTLKDRVLKITQAELVSRQLRGTLSGSIYLTPDIMKSRLTLTGKAEVPALGKALTVILRGTVDNPLPSVR